MKILKVEYKGETNSALFCLVTYEIKRMFRSTIIRTDMYSLRKFSSGGYSPIAYRCTDSKSDYDLSELMLFSKKGDITL